MRKLTNRQAAVLAALERRTEPVDVYEIAGEFPGLQKSTIFRVLTSLIKRGLVDWPGDWGAIYGTPDPPHDPGAWFWAPPARTQVRRRTAAPTSSGV
jgi:IclR helix-turn-helix domain